MKFGAKLNELNFPGHRPIFRRLSSLIELIAVGSPKIHAQTALSPCIHPTNLFTVNLPRNANMARLPNAIPARVLHRTVREILPHCMPLSNSRSKREQREQLKTQFLQPKRFGVVPVSPTCFCLRSLVRLFGTRAMTSACPLTDMSTVTGLCLLHRTPGRPGADAN